MEDEKRATKRLNTEEPSEVEEKTRFEEALGDRSGEALGNRSKKRKTCEPDSSLGDCSICCLKYNLSTRKKIVCPKCQYDSCRSCYERYFLNTISEPHCMNCRELWGYYLLFQFFTKVWVNTEWSKHRGRILLGHEKSRLPEAMEYVEKEQIYRRAYNDHIQKSGIFYAYHKKLYEDETTCTEEDKRKFIVSKIQYEQSLYVERKARHNSPFVRIALYRNIPRTIDDPFREATASKRTTHKKVFTWHCPDNECRGFLDENFVCGVCEIQACPDCLVRLNDAAGMSDHKCDPNLVETVKNLKKSTRQCPNCKIHIHKISGCFGSDTPVLLWGGGTVMSQHVKVGMTLVSDELQPTKVIQTLSGTDQMYRVKQTPVPCAVRQSPPGVLHTTIETTSSLPGVSCTVGTSCDSQRYAPPLPSNEYVVNGLHKMTFIVPHNGNVQKTGDKWSVTWFCEHEGKKRTEFFDTEKDAADFSKTLNLPERVEMLMDRYQSLDKTTQAMLFGYKIDSSISPPTLVPTTLQVEPLGISTYYGWRVDAPSKRFLLADMTCVKNCNQMWCLGKDTPVQMVSLKTSQIHPLPTVVKRACDVRLGDEVVGDDGLPRRVISVTEGYEMLYEVKTIDSKTLEVKDSYEVTEKHVLSLLDTEGKIHDMTVEHFLQMDPTTQSNFFAYKRIDGIIQPPTDPISISPKQPGHFAGFGVTGKTQRFLLGNGTVTHNCTQCYTAFDYKTGEIVLGRIHNPHYYEHKRQNGGLEREEDRIRAEQERRDPCGIPSYGQIVTFTKRRHIIFPLQEWRRLVVHVEDVIMPMVTRKRDTIPGIHSSMFMRIRYLLNEVSDEEWIQILLNYDRRRIWAQELLQIYYTWAQYTRERLRYLCDTENISRNQIETTCREILRFTRLTNGSLHQIQLCYGREIWKITLQRDWNNTIFYRNKLSCLSDVINDHIDPINRVKFREVPRPSVEDVEIFTK